MHREAKIRLRYSGDELKAILLREIGNSQGVAIETVEVSQDGTITFEGTESKETVKTHSTSAIGFNLSPLLGVPSRVSSSKRVTNAGMKPFTESLFKDGSQWPFERLLEEFRKKGFQVTSSYLRNYLKCTMKLAEIHPHVFQSPEFAPYNH
jgi:hypothetical protein